MKCVVIGPQDLGAPLGTSPPAGGKGGAPHHGSWGLALQLVAGTAVAHPECEDEVHSH